MLADRGDGRGLSDPSPCAEPDLAREQADLATAQTELTRSVMELSADALASHLASTASTALGTGVDFGRPRVLD